MPKTKKVSTTLSPKNNSMTLATQAKVETLAAMIVKSGATRYDIIQKVTKEWGLTSRQAEKYYTAAVNYLHPEDPEEYRDLLIRRNFEILEELLRRAMDSNDTKTALDVIKAINNLVGAGGKQVEISDKDKDGQEKKIIISFGD